MADANPTELPLEQPQAKRRHKCGRKPFPFPEIGDRFGRLVVSGSPFMKGKAWRIPCQCDCGNETSPTKGDLRYGRQSCGCIRRVDPVERRRRELEYGRRHYRENREKYLLQMKKWREENRDYKREQAIQYRFRQRASRPGYLLTDCRQQLQRKYAGRRFGHLTVKFFDVMTTGDRTVTCLCDCGRWKQFIWKYVRTIKIKSCGCLSQPAVVPIEEERAYRRELYLERRAKDPDAFRRRKRELYAANIEKRRKRSLANYYKLKAADPDIHKRRLREWRKKNKLKTRAWSARRRAREKRAAIGDLDAITTWERSWKRKPFVQCHWCRLFFRPPECHSDHVTPLSKLGSHSLDNLVIACVGCNLAKGDLPLEEWQKKLEARKRKLEMEAGEFWVDGAQNRATPEIIGEALFF